MSQQKVQDTPAKPTSPRKGQSVKYLIFAGGGALILAALGALLCESVLISGFERSEQTRDPRLLSPPGNEEMPDGEFGESARRGQAIFMNTPTNASDHVGNGLTCANCHLGEGRQPYSAPMWAAWGQHPKYRARMIGSIRWKTGSWTASLTP